MATSATPAVAQKRPIPGITLLLALIVVYLPYHSHYSVVLPLKGLNILNVLFLVCLFAVAARAGKTRTPTPLKGNLILFLAAITMAFVIAQMSGSHDFFDEATYWKNCLFYPLFYFLAYHALRDRDSIRLCFWAILFTTFLVSLQCVRQGMAYGLGNFNWSQRASGPFSAEATGANIAAAYFIIYSPLFITVWITCKSRWMARLAALPGALLGVMGVLATFSRQAMLIVPALFLVQALRGSRIVAVALLIGVLNYQFWVPQGIIDRIEMTTTHNEQGEEELDDSTTGRFNIWLAASQMIMEKPWGVGPGRFRLEIGKYAPQYFKIDAHNGFVLLTAESGIVATLAFLALLFRFIAIGRRVRRLDASEDSQLFGGALVIASIGVICSNLFGSRLFNGEVMGNYWILAGMVARYHALVLEERGATATAAAPGVAAARSAGPRSGKA